MPHKRSVFGTDWNSTPRRRYTDSSLVLLQQNWTSVYRGINILQSRLLRLRRGRRLFSWGRYFYH